MKIKLLAGLSMLVGLLSCSGENVIGGFNVDKEVVYNLAVEAPDMATTRLDGDDKSGKSSAFGAIDNADETFWANNDVRYILEVYEVGDDSNPVKHGKYPSAVCQHQLPVPPYSKSRVSLCDLCRLRS